MNKKLRNYGVSAYELLKKLFPITRSLTGNGVRETLRIIQKSIPISINEIKSGYKAFDWVVPDEWNIKDAFVMNPKGEKIIDFNKNNLHVLYYSTPFNGSLDLSDFKKKIYTIPEKPDLIPFVASYYHKNWGICMSHNQMQSLEEGQYQITIDSDLSPGVLNYGEVILKGKSKKEIFLSTYICHPSLANDNLSGVVVLTKLVEYLLSLKKRYYTYRIIFIPETIGALVYMSKNLPKMKKNIIAGYTITCVGDEGNLSYLKSKNENQYVDKISMNILNFLDKNFKNYDFIARGSDERQYSSVGADIPIGSIMKSKYHEYKEYHTSADNLDFVTSKGLNESINAYKKCIDAYENNNFYISTIVGEPQLSKRNLYPKEFQINQSADINRILDFLTYADGINDLIDISNKINTPIWELYDIVKILLSHKLIKKLEAKF